MNNKKTFVMNKEWSVVFDTLSDEKAAKLIRAIFAYQNGEDVNVTDPELVVIFSLITSVMERNNQKYDDRCEQNRQNVQKRYERIPSNTNDTKPTDNDNDNDIDNDVSNKPPKGGKKHPQTPSFEDLAEDKTISEPVKDAVREWLEYKKERREPYKTAGLKALLSQIETKEQENGASAVISVIRESMSNGWRGIIWDRMPKKEKSLAEEWGLVEDGWG